MGFEEVSQMGFQGFSHIGIKQMRSVSVENHFKVYRTSRSCKSSIVRLDDDSSPIQPNGKL